MLVHDGDSFAVRLQMLQNRLIGTMEIDLVLKFILFKISGKHREKSVKELRIFFGIRFHVPAENPFFPAVHFGNDLRGESCTPLGEQMGNFKIFDAAFLCKRNPAVQFLETERVFSLFQDHIDKLDSRALRSGFGIQRRSKDRSQDQIDPVFRRVFHEVADYAPVFLAEHIDVIIHHKAVRMKPVRIDEFLHGSCASSTSSVKDTFFRIGFSSVFGKSAESFTLDFIFAGLQFSGTLTLNHRERHWL